MNVPKLRFKNAEGADFPLWTMSKLGNEVQFSKGGKLGKSDLQKEGSHQCLLYGELYTSYGSIASKIFSRTDTDSDTTSQKYDVVMPTSGETAEDIATATCIPFDGILYGGDLIILRSQTLYGPFLSYQINSSLKRKISRVAQGKSVVHIGAEKIKPISFSFPCLEEQQKIASFFSTLDQKIDLNEQKLEALEKLKKGVMQKIFDQEFSFKNKEGKEFPEWEKAYLKDILLFQNGINTGKENFGTGIKLISVNEVLSPFPIKYDDISSSVMVDDNLGKKFSVTYGDVLFQRSSETREDAGTSNIYIDNTREAVFGGFVIRGKRIGDYNPIFLHELLRSSKVRQQIIKYAQGAQHINIGQESLKKIEIKLPCREEQEKIAELAIALYKKIELLTNKLKGLKNLKKGFMQQMFV